MACGDWAYSTDTGLGANQHPSGSPLWSIRPSEDPDDEAKVYSGSHDLVRSANKTWDKYCPVRGQFDMSLGINGSDGDTSEGDNELSFLEGYIDISDVKYIP